MDDYAIKVEGLSKRYRLGQNTKGDGLRHTIENAIRSPLSLFRKKQEKERSTDFWALSDVSFSINKGEVVGFVGRNGAGKSTLLKLLSRITEPTTGSINTRGRVASLLEVGTGFHPELTGRENIFLNGAILGMSRHEIKKRFDEIVDFSEVSKFLDTPVKRYSSGMYVRLAFSVAAHLEPEILIVDEVLAVGDAEFQAKCIGKMEDVAHRSGRTVLFVSHNMAAVQNLCSRAILLDQGKLICDSDTSTVLDVYGSRSRQKAKEELVNRTDRKGEGDVVIERLTIMDNNNRELKSVRTAQDVKIRLHYRSKPGVTFSRDAYVDIAVERDTYPMFVLSTAFPKQDAVNLEGSGHIDFIIPKIPLSEFTYRVSTFIRANNVIQDWVQDAAMLEVFDGDFFGTGRNCHPNWQGKYVLTPHTWEQSRD